MACWYHCRARSVLPCPFSRSPKLIIAIGAAPGYPVLMAC